MPSVLRRWSRLLVAMVVAACGASDAATEPQVVRTVNPLAGTYDLVAVADTFSFETGAPSPPDCLGYTLYCTHYRAAPAGATLAGTVVITDTTVAGAQAAWPLVPTGRLAGRACGVVDRTTLTGCAALGDSIVNDYAGRGAVREYYEAPGRFTVELRSVDLMGPMAVLHQARFAGDSLYGRVYWSSTVGRSPPTFFGNFVAHRRH